MQSMKDFGSFVLKLAVLLVVIWIAVNQRTRDQSELRTAATESVDFEAAINVESDDETEVIL